MNAMDKIKKEKFEEALEDEPEPTLIARITMLLAAKRTSLAVMRTGIAVLTLPFSVVTVLIATSGHYKFADNLLFIVPLMALNTGLVILSGYLIIRSIIRIHTMDKLVHKIKEHDKHLMTTTDWENGDPI